MKDHCQRPFFGILASVCVSVLMLGSCSGESPFLQVQLCAQDAQGVDRFKNTLRDIADVERIRYIDGSAATTRDLKVLNPAGKNIHTDGRLVNVALEADGYGLMAGNLGLNPYDISVGFSPDTPAGRAFSERVLARLSHQWALKFVPEGSGALPDPACTSGEETPPNNAFKPTSFRGPAQAAGGACHLVHPAARCGLT